MRFGVNAAKLPAHRSGVSADRRNFFGKLTSAALCREAATPWERHIPTE